LDLKDFLANYPAVHVATTTSDDERVKFFFHQLPMKGKGLQLQYQRLPTFQAFLDCHSDRSWVLFVQNEQGVVEGAGTIILRQGLVHGRPTTVGYLGDLRIDNIRRWGRYWRDFYLALMRESRQIAEFSDVDYFLTAVMKDNKRAQKALGQSAVGYHPYHDYRMVNVLGAWRPTRASFKAQTWREIGEEKVWAFHRATNLTKPLGWSFNERHHEGHWRLKHWPDFTLDDGVTLSDSQGIALSAAFWSPTKVKKIILQRIPRQEAIGLLLLRPFFNLPREGEELRCLYLTMLDGRADLSEEQYQKGVEQLIAIGLGRAKASGFHCLSVAEFGERPLKRALASYLSFRTDLELFLVNPDKNPVSELGREVPGFEMGLV
jgi:hypothetical protein